MIQLIYVSTATRDLSEQDLLELLEQSRERNKRQQVTGLLLYAGHNFIQLLEGDAADVDDIYQSILEDDRNRENLVIWRKVVEERVFPDWAMGFRRVTRFDGSPVDGFTEFLEEEVDLQAISNQRESILELFNFFKHDNA